MAEFRKERGERSLLHITKREGKNLTWHYSSKKREFPASPDSVRRQGGKRGSNCPAIWNTQIQVGKRKALCCLGRKKNQRYYKQGRDESSKRLVTKGGKTYLNLCATLEGKRKRRSVKKKRLPAISVGRRLCHPPSYCDGGEKTPQEYSVQLLQSRRSMRPMPQKKEKVTETKILVGAERRGRAKGNTFLQEEEEVPASEFVDTSKRGKGGTAVKAIIFRAQRISGEEGRGTLIRTCEEGHPL